MNLRRALVSGLVVLGGAAASLAQDALKYTWSKGEVVHYRSVQENVGKMTAMGMTRTTTQRQEFVQRFEVKDVDAEGVATLDVSVLSVKIVTEQGEGGSATYDTTKPADQQYDGSPRLKASMEYMGALIGEHMTVTMEPTGAVRKVEGMAKVVDKMQAKMGNANAMAARNLRTAMGDEAMRASLERFFRVLPPKPVAKGDTWTTSLEQPMAATGGRLKLDVNWTNAGPADSATKLTSDIKVELVPPKEGEEGGVAPGMKTTLKDGKGNGESLFDAKTGKLVKSIVNMQLPLEVSMSSPNGQSMTMSNDTTSKFTLERIAAPAEGEKPADAKPAAH
jgi:hypothetical protein